MSRGVSTSRPEPVAGAACRAASRPNRSTSRNSFWSGWPSACEIEGATQAEAAERVGLTRLRVNKGLSDLRQRGILRVSIDSIYAASAELEWRLADRFGLTRAVVVPSPEKPSAVTPLVSAGLGGHLGGFVAGPRDAPLRHVLGQYAQPCGRGYMQPINPARSARSCR